MAVGRLELQTADTGAERARVVDSLSSDVLLLHDRTLPHSAVRIDHLAVTANGVWVIAISRERGRIAKVDGRERAGTGGRLTVAGRDRADLLIAVRQQVEHVREALVLQHFASVPVHGALCFVDAEWDSVRTPFVVERVVVTGGNALRYRLTEQGSVEAHTRMLIHRMLAQAFRPQR